MARTRRFYGSIRRLPSGRWQARYHDPLTGARLVAPMTFASKAAASRWLSTIEADVSRGEHLDPRLSQRTFAEWADEWLRALHVKPKTVVGYESSLRNHVLPVLGSRPMSSITYRDCKHLVTALLASGLAPGTVGEARKVLRLVLGEALRADAIRRNPADGLRVPRGPRREMVFLSAEEGFALAGAIGSANGQREPTTAYGLIVRLAAFTGLRAGEIAALRVGRLDLFRGRLEVAESVEEVRGRLVYGPPKTYAVRNVPLPKSLTDELALHLSGRPAAPDTLVFTSPMGGPMRHGNFYRRYFKPAVLRAGLDPRTRFHDLRHTAAALMIAEGAHLLAVKERLGHSTIQVTADRYGHLFPSLEAALTDRLDETYRVARANLGEISGDGDRARSGVD